MYVFLRALKLSTAACVLAAATYAFAGPVLSQVNHVDMTEGFVAIPWMLLAVLHIVRDGRWRWSILLGIAFASVILAGAPEAMLDEALLVIAFAAMSAGLDRERWWRVLSQMRRRAPRWPCRWRPSSGCPGLEAIRNSQRGSGVVAAAGSYPRPFTVFGLVPYLDGGYGHLGEAQFFGQYNLPEVGIYLGILPVVALLTLLHPRWPSRIPPAGPPHLVCRRALRPPPGAGLEHAPGASLQQPAALREPAPAEPQHDHGGHRGLRPVRRSGSIAPRRPG